MNFILSKRNSSTLHFKQNLEKKKEDIYIYVISIFNNINKRRKTTVYVRKIISINIYKV